MKYLKMLVLSSLLILLLSSCGKTKSIEGSWERNDKSVLNGMEISLEKLDNGDFRAKVIKGDESGLFQTGNVKWRDVKKVKDGEYDLYDLGDKGQWYEMTMIYNSDDDKLLLSSFDNQGEVGSSQEWTRIK